MQPRLHLRWNRASKTPKIDIRRGRSRRRSSRPRSFRVRYKKTKKGKTQYAEVDETWQDYDPAGKKMATATIAAPRRRNARRGLDDRALCTCPHYSTPGAICALPPQRTGGARRQHYAV